MKTANEIIRIMLGNAQYEQLITDIVKEYRYMNLEISDVEPILDSYFTAILLIGFSKKSNN